MNSRPPAAPRLSILYEDAFVVWINKPAGLASVASRGVQGKNCLSELRVSHPAARAVHRLDQETSGVMVFALNEEIRASLEECFRDRQVEKLYWALVQGHPQPPSGVIRRPIKDLGARASVRADGKPAETRYRITRRFADACLVEARPVTGRYNQIRLHFAAVGHPLVGERKYARGRESKVRFRRVALHARSIEFEHPKTGEKVAVKAPLPADMEQLMQRLSERPGAT